MGEVQVTTQELFGEQILKDGNWIDIRRRSDANNLHAFRCISKRCHEE